jgi:class 3 adenylate cyclase
MARTLWRSCVEVDVWEVLSSVRVPTLVVARPGDHIVSLDASAALAAAIPNAQFLTIPPGDHHGFDVVDVLVSEFLKFCERPSASHSERTLAAVLFTDIVGSTEQLTAVSDEHWGHQLDVHDQVSDTLLARYGGQRVNHTGDGIFALLDSPTKAARCALELVSALAMRGIRIRAGVHVGECERRGEEWSGLAVHVGARIGAMAGPGEVLTSRTVRDLSAGSGLQFKSLGAHRIKGISEDTEVFQVS